MEHNEKQMNEINEEHTNEKYLPGIKLPENINGYFFVRRSIEGVETVVLAVPTKAIS